MAKLTKKAKMVQDAESAEEAGVTATDLAPTRRNLLSTGSTLLNLGCADNPFGGFLKGKYYFMVGDSSSGKTFLSMTCFAEACVQRHFKNYRLIYDNVEDGCLLDLDTLFNEAVADRVEPPALDAEGNPHHSTTVEEFYYHVDDAVREGKPFVYVLDSMDGLTSAQEEGKFEEHKEAFRKGKDAAGSYGDGKAKKNSEGLRKVLKGLRSTGSILIILCQTRDNVTGMGYDKKTRSGGHALRFYATVEIWSSIDGAIRKTVKGKDRQVGIRVKLRLKKNRITGKLSEVIVPIYPSYGIDDIGSCVDYLIEEGWWEGGRKGEKIQAKEFGLEASREKIIRHIEDEGKEDELRAVVGHCWKEIQSACALPRKKRYI